MTVSGLYFCMRGFTKTKYIEYEVALMNINKSPTGVALPLSLELNTIIVTAPMAPMITPTTFRTVGFSFKIKMERTKTIIGVEVMIIDEFNGEVRINPLKKNN